MTVNCPQVASALRILKRSGIDVLEVSQGWSNVKEDYRMKNALSSELKDMICNEEPSLEYWEYSGSPHNSPDEGFVCKEHSVSISFPRKE